MQVIVLLLIIGLAALIIWDQVMRVQRANQEYCRAKKRCPYKQHADDCDSTDK